MLSLIIQYSPFIMLCLGSIGMDCVTRESCYKGTILQSNHIIAMKYYVSYNFFENTTVIKFGSHNMTVLNSNLFYNEVCYKETALKSFNP